MSSNDEELLKAETNDLKACRDPTGGLRREGLISFQRSPKVWDRLWESVFRITRYFPFILVILNTIPSITGIFSSLWPQRIEIE
jgi:hypothetical protein